jgi:hypothetical protein
MLLAAPTTSIDCHSGFFFNGGLAMLEFSLFGRRPRPSKTTKAIERRQAIAWESLENRQLLSAGLGMRLGPEHDQGGFGGGLGRPPGDGAGMTIEFNQAPAAVQTGLTSLASTDGVTAPSADSTVYLGNANGTETYTSDVTGTGTETRLTVDQNGNPVTPPTRSTTTFGAITNTAVTNEINAIASALDLTAPTSTTNVFVQTASDGSAVYSLTLTPTSSSSSTTDTDAEYERSHGALISVDSSGNPVGQERVPLSVLSTVIQTGLTSNAPTGATALLPASLIDVNTLEGVTLYTAHYSSTGTQTTVTVNAAGALTSLPSIVDSTFGDIPTAAQAELQALATADGFTGTIDATLNVTESVEANGTIIYTIRLPISSDSSTSEDVTLTLSVDALGNPTVPPRQGAGRFVSPPLDCPGSNNGGDSGDGDSSGTGGTTSSGGTIPSSGSGEGSAIDSDTGGTPAASATTAAAVTASTTSETTTTTVLTKAEERAAAKALAKATRLAKVEARQAAALAAKVARDAAAAARKAARLAAAVKSEG